MNHLENIDSLQIDTEFSKENPNFMVNNALIEQKAIESIYSNLLVQCNIWIEGKEVLKGSNFELNIIQKTSDHDEFEIICHADSLESPNTLPLTRTREYLGKTTSISFKQFGKEAYIFNGIITGIVNDKFNNYEGNIIIKGNAPTILLENGLDCESYENKNLKNVITKATEEYKDLKFDIQPRTKDIFPYTVQYKESDFQFLKRMSERYGEWFYYNGKEIIFGQTQGKEIELLEDRDVEKFEFQMKTLPQKFQYMAYNAKTAQMEEVISTEVSYGGVYNAYVVKALNASEKMYTKTPNTLYNQSLLEMGRTELRSAVERQKKSRANLFEVFIKTTNPNVQLGDIVKLKGYMPGNHLLNTSDVPLESYRVTEIKHHHSDDEYYNEIIGVPKDQEIPSYINEDAIPRCEEQSAIVTDNNDPYGMGRIRVEFPWQKPFGEKSPWIRLITPYAGNGKGMHVIPEIGEEVLISFENANAEKPVVLGAMYNGSGKSGLGGAGNFMKGLTTAAGSKLLFNDQSGSMNLADQGGASMDFDGAGNASTQVNQNHDINAGANSSISAGSASSINAGSNHSVNVGGGSSALQMDSAGNISLNGATSITFSVGGTSIKIDSGGVNILSAAAINAVAASIVNLSSNKTIVHGNRVALKGSQVLLEGESSIKGVSPDTDIF